jgi:hypothetical protein
MRIAKALYPVTTGFIASVWAVSGLFCKVLHWVPRHQLIVARILGESHAAFWTVSIGMGEVCMAIWILTGIRRKLCARLQILLVITMNAIEFTRAPDLLLFGRWNALFAVLFVGLVYCNEFVLRRKARNQLLSWAHS